MDKLRIFLAGVGGQGTLTATTLLARTALDEGAAVTSGEIHGMAQRGGVVESTVLIGGYSSPRIDHGEADILLGFEPLETLRALPYLHTAGKVFSNQNTSLPPGVAMGKEHYPDAAEMETTIRDCAAEALFLPCLTLARQAGSVLAANIVLLGALFGSGILPFGFAAFEKSIRSHLKPAIVDVNLTAAELGRQAGAA